MPIEFSGLEGILERFDALTDEETISVEGLNKACALVERTAKQTAPKKDGELRRSITYKVEGLSGKVFTPLFYAPYVEYGTGLFSVHPMGGRKDVPWTYFDEKKQEYFKTYGQQPQPYMRPALDTNRDEILKLIRGAILND